MPRSKPKWIVVIEGLKPGVYPCWLDAAPFIKGKAIYQGFDTEEEARAKWDQHVRQGTVVNTSVVYTSSNVILQTPNGPESNESPYRRSARLAAKRQGAEASTQAIPQEASLETLVQTPRYPRVFFGYPQDGLSAYVKPSGRGASGMIKRGSPANTEESTFPFDFEDSSSGSRRSSASSIESFETTRTSVSDDDEGEGRAQGSDHGAPQLSPLSEFSELSLMEIEAAPAQISVSRAAEKRPIKKESPQERNTSISNPSTPRATREISRTSHQYSTMAVPRPCRLTEHDLRNVTMTRGSPSRRQAPRKMENTGKLYYSVRVPSTPIRSAKPRRVISISDSSDDDSPPPAVSRTRAKLPISAA